MFRLLRKNEVLKSDGRREFWVSHLHLASFVRQRFMGGDAPEPWGGSGERRGSQDDHGSDELGTSRDSAAGPSTTGSAVDPSPPVHRPPVRLPPRPPDETEIRQRDTLPPAPGAQRSQIPETQATQSLRPFQHPEILLHYNYNPTQQQGSPFTIVPPDTPSYQSIAGGSVDLSAYLPWGNPLPPTGSFVPVHGSPTSVGVGGNIATAPEPPFNPRRKSGVGKLSRTIKTKIRKKTGFKRVGRRGRHMCARCRRMRNPDKYPCTPLDDSNPTGGCVECHEADIPCGRRETPAEGRERLKTLLMPMGSVAPWRPQVYRNDDVRAMQADLITVAQSAASPQRSVNHVPSYVHR